MEASTEPQRMKVIFESIPEEMKKQKQYVLWNWVKRDGKLTKPLYQVNGKYAKANDSSTWTGYKAAKQAYEMGSWDGIGYVLNDDYVGIDWDDCRDPETGKIDEITRREIAAISSYTEVSPSGTGFKTIVKAKPIKKGHHSDKYGVFSKGRYFCITGHCLNDSKIEYRQSELDEFIQRHWPNDYEEKQNIDLSGIDQDANAGTSNLSDLELIEKAKAADDGGKFARLWQGNAELWDESNPEREYKSHSEADYHLCLALAFWTNKDAARIDRLFRQSGLMRDKWNRKRYRELTIEKAISKCTYTYSSQHLSSKKILDSLERDEDGDASIFIHLNRGKHCFDHSANAWFNFNKNYWEEDRINQVTANMQGPIDTYIGEARRQGRLRDKAEEKKQMEAAERHKKIQDALYKRGRKLHTAKRKEQVLKLAAAGEDSLGIRGDEWDSDPLVLGCRNGVVDLKTGDRRDGLPGDFIKTVASAEWKGIDAPRPKWKRFLNEIFSEDSKLIDYVQKLYGYGITGLSRLHIIVFLWGIGRNGKGTLTETIKYVMGDLAYKAESELLLDAKYPRQSGAPNSGILALRGKRIVTASETGQGQRLNAPKIKEIVGGDTLNARAPYGKRHVEFTPSHLLLLLTNNKPQAPANDFALWQRIHLVPFNISFVREPKKPNERKLDIELPEKLKEEASGILAWLVEGCLKWQAEGLEPPESVKNATQAYRAEEDLIGHFLSSCCIITEIAETKAGDMYKAYRRWCEENGHKPWNQTRFGTDMKGRFDSDESRRHVYYLGVRLDAQELDVDLPEV